VEDVLKTAKQSVSLLGLAPSEISAGYTSLLDGKTLAGWRQAHDFRVEDGLIVYTSKSEDGNEATRQTSC